MFFIDCLLVSLYTKQIVLILQVYMTFVQALYGGGGWPLSVFISPDLKPLMGGTYFPPDDKYGRPGFKTILRWEFWFLDFFPFLFSAAWLFLDQL